jgi:hypothetical protein
VSLSCPGRVYEQEDGIDGKMPTFKLVTAVEEIKQLSDSVQGHLFG